MYVITFFNKFLSKALSNTDYSCTYNIKISLIWYFHGTVHFNSTLYMYVYRHHTPHLLTKLLSDIFFRISWYAQIFSLPGTKSKWSERYPCTLCLEQWLRASMSPLRTPTPWTGGTQWSDCSSTCTIMDTGWSICWKVWTRTGVWVLTGKSSREVSWYVEMVSSTEKPVLSSPSRDSVKLPSKAGDCLMRV